MEGWMDKHWLFFGQSVQKLTGGWKKEMLAYSDSGIVIIFA